MPVGSGLPLGRGGRSSDYGSLKEEGSPSTERANKRTKGDANTTQQNNNNQTTVMSVSSKGSISACEMRGLLWKHEFLPLFRINFPPCCNVR